MNDTTPEPRMIHCSAQPAAVLREQVPMSALTEFFGRAFGTVMAAAQAQNVELAGPPFALYRGTPTQTVDVEAGFPIIGTFNSTEGVVASTLPEAQAVEAIHVGPYDTLEKTYGVIQQLMKTQGLSPSETMWEYYLNGPETEPDPSKWETQVIWPVASTDSDVETRKGS